MKKCPMCGVNVDDHASECPECGCPLADTSGFSLKGGNPSSKKGGNSLGKSISTGSGLTDILREGDDAYDSFDDDQSSIGGSIPISLSRTDVGDLSTKKKSKLGKYIFRIVILAALAYGAYFLITNYFIREKAKSYQEALDYYVDAVNEEDYYKLEIIIPPYVKDNEGVAEDYLDNISVLHINSYNVRDIVELSDSDIDDLMESIKLSTGKTAKIKEGYRMIVDLKVTVEGESSQYVKGQSFMINANMEFINIKDNWYLQIDAYENIDYN